MKELKDCRVLIVDDTRDNVNVLVAALKDDYRIGFALDGQSALKFAQTKSPDLILLDIMMPGMDGYEVCRRLKADADTRDIPILFLSALDEVRSKSAGFEAGAVDYITKPFEILEVKARIRTHLSLRLAHAELARQRDVMQRSLDLASEVQQRLLPQADPRAPGLDIAGRSIYCDQTGGDYYDYLTLGGEKADRIGVVVGDVAEHGIPSALIMASVRAFLRQRAAMPGTLDGMMADVNRQLYPDVADSGRFVTLFFCEIDPVKKSLTWVNAGHDPALLYDARKDAFESLSGRNMALGLMPDAGYEAHSRHLEPGQILVIGTDGIWEAHGPDGGMFGKDRLQEVIRSHRGATAAELCECIVNAVRDFRGSGAAEDDLTLVVVGIRP